jgi:hypothetical protein
MTTVNTAPETRRRITYVVLGAIFVVMLVAALAVFRSAKSTAEADEKADQLIAALNEAGLPVPTKDQIVRVLGDDGGAVCADPNSALKRAALYDQLTNGAGGPGLRPVIADRTVVQGELLVIEIYCPEELEEFREFVNDLKFDDVVKEE